MLESYLAYALIPLFFIILFGLVYFALIKPNASAATDSTTSTPKRRTSAAARSAADSDDNEKMI